MNIEVSCGKCPIWSFCSYMKKEIEKANDVRLTDYCPLIRSAAFSFSLLIGEYETTVNEMLWWLSKKVGD